MTTKEHAKKHSMDISHVAAVELPFNVKNTDRAVKMLGGKERIHKAISSQYRPTAIQPSSHAVDDKNLELRLRNDPFHHPVQASVNRREKVLLKVSIPKSSLPKDYEESPQNYTVRELIKRNTEKGGHHVKVEPVAIINKNYNFRAIADFQMSTKNNKMAQDFNKQVLRANKVDELKEFYKKKLTVTDELKDPEVFENKDHQLIPPPHFSGVRFPFDFRYQKSPYTVTIRDDEGDMKVVMKSDSKKLFTNTVDFYNDDIPKEPLPEIVKKYEWMINNDLSQEYADRKLFDCIHNLSRLFELKPIWLRKLLVDVTPTHLKAAVKEALPYVSYCYKNGPWRFCNVRLGINPKDDKSYWMYQSGYFRLQGLRTKFDQTEDSTRVLPNTIKMTHPDSDVKVSEHLLFTGKKLPRAINYQIGDIMDEDVMGVIKRAEENGELLRDTLDPQEGWINYQTFETIRRIVRYKLRRLYKEEPIDRDKIHAIVEADYAEKDGEAAVDVGEEDEDEEEADLGDNEDEENQDQNGVEDENDIEEDILDDNTVTEGSVFDRIKKADGRAAEKLKEFVGFIKQESTQLQD